MICVLVVRLEWRVWDDGVCSRRLLSFHTHTLARMFRARHSMPPPLDLVRVVRAERRYSRGFRDMYQDNPRDLWD